MKVVALFACVIIGVYGSVLDNKELTSEQLQDAANVLSILTYDDLMDIYNSKMQKRKKQCPDRTYDCMNNSGKNKCISYTKLCNGEKDCPNGADEGFMCKQACGDAGMTKDQWVKGYYCKDDYKCLTEAQKCDGTKDCSNDKNEETANLGCSKKSMLRDLLEAYLNDAKN